MKPGKTMDDELKKVMDALENMEITPMSKEETALLLQRVMETIGKIMELNKNYQLMMYHFNLYQSQTLKLDAEIGIAESFIFSKGYRKEYHSFKEKRLKIFNQNQQKVKPLK